MTTLKRINYYDKYTVVGKTWGLDEKIVLNIIKKYSIKLAEELLSEEPWTISKFFRDNRTNEEYIFDILDGQLVEELVCEWFIAKGSNAKRTGSDADGVIVRNNKKRITTNADLLVDGKSVEIQISRQGRRSKYHIKKNKGNRILRGENTLMFIIGDEYFVVEGKDLERAPIIRNPCYGGKECFELSNITYTKL